MFSKNKALEINDKLAPFLTPMPSDNEQLIRTAVEFSLELTTQQISCLTKLQHLAIDLQTLAESLHDSNPLGSASRLLESHKVALFVSEYKDGKRFHKAKEFIGDLIASISYYAFAQAGNISANVSKTSVNK